MFSMTTSRLLILLFCFITVGCQPTNEKNTVSSAEKKAGVPQNAALGRNLDLKTTTHFAGFAAMNQANVTADADRLIITSSGEDPQIAIPKITIVRPSQFAARVEMTVPKDTVVQLYYTTTTTPAFSAENVASVEVKTGRSTMLFEINDPNFTGTLRFDPGQTTGEYIIHGFELFSSEPLALAPQSSPATPTP